jgi:hypothetical protein
MRTLKSNDGLTRGRGMEKMQRTVWLLSMPSCASVNRSMQSLTQTAVTTSEQHKEVSEARQKREHKDTFKITKFLLARNPFESDEELRSIVTGQAAQKIVNVDNAKETGKQILHNFTGQSVCDVSFKKSNQAVTMATVSALKIGEDVVHVDPQLLFQRVLAVVREERVRLEDIFTYMSSPTIPCPCLTQMGSSERRASTH